VREKKKKTLERATKRETEKTKKTCFIESEKIVTVKEMGLARRDPIQK